MEIKICEEYLIRENEQLQQKVEDLNKINSMMAIEISEMKNEIDFMKWKSKCSYAYKEIKNGIKKGKPLLLCDEYYLRDVSSLVEKIGYKNVEELFKKDIEEEAKKEVQDEEAEKHNN